MNTDDRALADLIARLTEALDFDAQAGTDAQWSRLMAEAMNARDRLEAFHAKPTANDPVIAFEEYWGASKYRTRNMIGYSDKKCLAWEAYSAALQSPPPVVSGEDKLTMTIRLTDDEQAAIERLMTEQELSRPQIFRCALRSYQADHERRKAGETVTWSGDAQRARDFAGPLATPPVVEEGRRETAIGAAYLAIYGDGMDPLEHPEGWEYATTIADAILALTPVEGVGDRYSASGDHVVDADERNTFQVVAINRIDGDSLAIGVAEAMNAALSTPVAAQGDEVREALEKIDKWCCPLLCTNCRDNRATARAALATLGAPHEG